MWVEVRFNFDPGNVMQMAKAAYVYVYARRDRRQGSWSKAADIFIWLVNLPSCVIKKIRDYTYYPYCRYYVYISNHTNRVGTKAYRPVNRPRSGTGPASAIYNATNVSW